MKRDRPLRPMKSEVRSQVRVPPVIRPSEARPKSANCRGAPVLEVDIWSEKKKLAIMLDTTESISEASLYRQARHEDALLQHNGIRVIRFLVEDICERLDSVLGEIVAFRGHGCS